MSFVCVQFNTSLLATFSFILNVLQRTSSSLQFFVSWLSNDTCLALPAHPPLSDPFLIPRNYQIPLFSHITSHLSFLLHRQYNSLCTSFVSLRCNLTRISFEKSPQTRFVFLCRYVLLFLITLTTHLMLLSDDWLSSTARLKFSYSVLYPTVHRFVICLIVSNLRRNFRRFSAFKIRNNETTNLLHGAESFVRS